MDTDTSQAWQWLGIMDPDHRFATIIMIVIFVFITIVVAISMIGGVVRSIHQTRVESALKRELLDRGLAADEIARIVEARGRAKAKDLPATQQS